MMDSIDDFFAQFPAFDYNRAASSPREFYRMCDFLGWIKDGRGHYPRQRVEAHAALREAMIESFNNRFGTDVNDRKAWEGICDLLGKEPLPETVKDMKEVSISRYHIAVFSDAPKLVKSTHVNLSDLLDAGRSGGKAHIFQTEADLAAYTIREGRFFPKDEAYAGGVLKYLLREIIGKYRGHKGRRKGKGKGKKASPRD